SVEHADIKRKYAMAEAQATVDLAAELARVKDSDCKKYNRLLEKERTRLPVRILDEAARRTPCTPLPRCDSESLALQGQAHLAAGQDVDAFMSYEAAYACNPTPARAQKALTAACSLRNVARARSYWKQMAPAMRTQAVDTCVRN